MHEELRPIRSLHIAGLTFRTVCSGEGAARAATATREALDASPFDRVLVVGIAGGLSSDLAAGDLVQAARVFDDRGETASPDTSWLAPLEIRSATCLSSSRVLSSTREKREAFERLVTGGPAIVDLESAAIGREAAARGIPFSVLRGVSDAHDEPLPIDVERFRRADGTISRARIASHTVLRPWTWPSLARLRRRTRCCAQAIAERLRRMPPTDHGISPGSPAI